MTYEFDCPWCQGRERVTGAKMGSWRFRLPCVGCGEMIVLTFDGSLFVSKAGGALARSEDATVPFQISPVLI